MGLRRDELGIVARRAGVGGVAVRVIGAVGLAAACVVMVGGAGRAESAGWTEQPGAGLDVASGGGSPGEIDQLAARLMDATLTDRARQGAADELVKRAEEDGVRAMLARALAGPLAGTGGGIYVLRGVATSPDVSLRLFSMLSQRLSAAPMEERPRVYEALGSFRTRDAARLLVAAVEGAEAEQWAEARAAAFGALERLSSREDLARDAAAWRDWLARSEALTESEWRFALLGDLSKRSMAVERERDLVLTRLVEALRKQHLLMAQGERSVLIAALLGDEQARVRALGFELASRELAAGNTPGPEVVEAARRLLGGRLASVRASAADLLRAIAPEDGGPTIHEALARETDPVVAAALLRAASRWPSSETAPAVMRWIEAGPPASDAAFEAAWQLSRVAQLTSDDGARVLARLRALDAASLTPAGCTLLASLGDDEDRDALMPLLRGGAPAVRLAIAEALVFDPVRSDAVLAAATMDDALFDAAIRTALANDPTATDFAMARALPAPTSEVRVAGLLRLARGLSSMELLTALQAEGIEPAMRSQLLTLLVGQDRVLSEMASPDGRRAIGRGVFLLASAQVERGELEAAAATIESSPFAARPVEVEGLEELRIAVLAGLGRFELIDGDNAAIVLLDEASANGMEGPPEPVVVPIEPVEPEVPRAPSPPGIVEAWVRGAELGSARPTARAVLSRVRAQFGTQLTDGQRARLGRVEGALVKNGGVDVGAVPKVERGTPSESPPR